jgi:hypothetical protein
VSRVSETEQDYTNIFPGWQIKMCPECNSLQGSNANFAIENLLPPADRDPAGWRNAAASAVALALV